MHDKNSSYHFIKFQEHQLPVEPETVREWFSESRKNISVEELRSFVFDQLICQRLQRGFQIILLKKKIIHSAIDASVNSEMVCKVSMSR